MRRSNLTLDTFHRASLLSFIGAAMFLTICVPAAWAQQRDQKTFSSAEEACAALAVAAQNSDEKALLEIFGPDGKEIVSSGDSTEDAENRANFARRYEQMHRLVNEPNGMTTLYVGAENWPAPIPLVHKGNMWYFDTEAGKMEILYRRVGLNEASAIRICQELVAAQKEYAVEHGGEYAQKIYSDQGQHNGLYWDVAAGERQSPIGPLVAKAVSEGYAKTESESVPYRGYYFHILTSQGKKSYIVDGKMTAGFAFVAYPAGYRSSGVMTFIVDQDGVVYQKDLGKKTQTICKGMKEYNLKAGWQKAEPQGPEEASGAPAK